jgi:hypothetical protein
MALRVMWQYMDRSVTKKILYGPQLHILFFWWRTGPYTAISGPYNIFLVTDRSLSGADPGFQVRGAHLKKMRPAEGGAKIFGIFRVKNHDFTPKNHIFSNCGGRCEIFGVFRVKNHDFTPKNHFFFNFREGARRVRPPLDPPLYSTFLASSQLTGL